MIFEPDWSVVANLPDFSQEVIRNEPMIFSASMDFALNNGGPITKAFLGHLCPWNDWIIDSKTLMLMKGMYPCIPGWHHDDVPRSRKDGQPNYETPEYRSIHRACVVGDASLTDFIIEPIEMPNVPLGKTVYQVWDKFINSIEPRSVQIQSGEVIDFSWQTFHRGMKATKNGWRFFIRASRQTNRQFKNEIRKQIQVYLDDASLGW